MNTFRKLILFALLNLQACYIVAQNYAPIDSSFGENGLAIAPVLGYTDGETHKVLVQPDGKVILIGYYTVGGERLVVCRFTSDGQPDPSFGKNGKVELDSIGDNPYSPYFDPLLNMLNAELQPDGKILICGGLYFPNSSFILRLNADGTPDPAFGTAGVVMVQEINGTAGIILSGIHCESDGNLIAIGEWRVSPDNSPKGLIIRMQANGAPDSTFGTQGRLVVDQDQNSVRFHKIRVLPDGKLLICGRMNSRSLLTRRLPDGKPDSTFNGKGYAGLPSEIALIPNFVIRPDGRIVVSTLASVTKAALFQLKPDGTVDSTFGVNGKFTPLPTIPFNRVPGDLLLLPNGNIITNITNSSYADVYTLFLCRVLPSGKADLAFGASGYLDPGIKSTYWGRTSVTFSPNGNMLIASAFANGDAVSCAVFRLNLDGSPDSTFNGVGHTVIRFPKGVQLSIGAILQEDQRIVSGGLISGLTPGNGLVNARAGFILRHDAQGNLDTNIAGTIGYCLDASSPESYLWPDYHGMAERANGKILIWGRYFTPDGTFFALSRFQPNGICDNTFHQTGTLVFTSPPYAGFFPELSTRLPDKKLVFVQEDNNVIRLLRFTLDDEPDPSFGNSGFVEIPVPQSLTVDIAFAAANAQLDGKVLLAGWANENGRKYLVVRLNPDGSLDQTFGGEGYVLGTLIDNTNSVSLYDIIEAGGDEILLYGEYWNTETNSELIQVIARINADGSKDLAFGGGDAEVIVPEPPMSRAMILIQLGVQPDKKILACGWMMHENGEEDIMLARCEHSGKMDTTFGINGLLTLDLGSPVEKPISVLQTASGQMIVAGETDGRLFLLRLLPDLSVDAADLVQRSDKIMVYPTPLREHATFSFELFETTDVSLYLFDAHGSLVQQFLDFETRLAGEHREQLRFSPQLPPGVYTLQIKTNRGQAALRVVLAQ